MSWIVRVLVPAVALRNSSTLDYTRQMNYNVPLVVVHIVHRLAAGFLPWKSAPLGLDSASVVVVEELVQALLGCLDPTCLQDISIPYAMNVLLNPHLAKH